ncbi:MAG: hypothetical protein BroJett025_02720 [Patescibacteria group bacterium]|nr:MAG: hypothetical protein BroJett025_02720 [Patescibacteria group bacterium]
MPRQTITNRYINESELDRQLGGLVADTSGHEHAEAVHKQLDEYYTNFQAKKDAGHLSEDEIKFQQVMHRVNAATQPESSHDRWQRQHNAYEKVKETEQKMVALNHKYRAGKVDDSTYWSRMAKYSEEAEEAKKEL